MEEKKLTDEEIVKALTCKKEVILEEVHRTNNSVDDLIVCVDDLIVCVDAKVVVGALDFIHRLQDDYSNLKERYVKILGLNEKVIAEQKAEIERLTQEKEDWEKSCKFWSGANKSNHLKFTHTLEKLCEERNKNSELQKQVDELKEKIMNLKSAMTDRVAGKSYDTMLTTPEDVEEIFGDAYESEFNKFLEQTVKDTAKEILEYGTFLMPIRMREWIKKRFGVEVE